MTFATSDFEDTSKVQAGWTPVSCRVSSTALPAGWSATTGVTVISSSWHGPSGCARAALCGVPVGDAEPVLSGRGPSGPPFPGVGFVDLPSFEAAGVAESGSPPPEPSTCARPQTIANAVPSTSARRNQ